MAKTEQKKGLEPKIMQHEIFVIVQTGRKQYKIALGNQFITDKTFESASEAKKYIDTKPWDLLFNMASYICTYFQKAPFISAVNNQNNQPSKEN